MTFEYAADSNQNDTFWKNPKFNELLTAARSELDEKKRAAMYAECQQLIHDDNGVIVIMFTTFVTGSSSKVEPRSAALEPRSRRLPDLPNAGGIADAGSVTKAPRCSRAPPGLAIRWGSPTGFWPPINVRRIAEMNDERHAEERP